MTKSSRRGQAALEYLFTYGWAFLAIAITLGALYYFGVFDFAVLQQDECVFPPGAFCADSIINDSDGGPEILFVLRNVYGTNLYLQDINATSTETGLIACDPRETDWDEEEELLFNCSIPPETFVVGDRYDFTIEARFNQQGEVYNHTLLGWIKDAAQ